MSTEAKPDRCMHPEGYVLVYSPEHPRSMNHGYVLEHILVMEGRLGRFLISPEEIHHDNEDKTDNRIENLILCKDRKEHMQIHAANRIRSAGGNPDTQRWCSGCGVQDKSAFSNGKKSMCRPCHATYEYQRLYGRHVERI